MSTPIFWVDWFIFCSHSTFFYCFFPLFGTIILEFLLAVSKKPRGFFEAGSGWKSGFFPHDSNKLSFYPRTSPSRWTIPARRAWLPGGKRRLQTAVPKHKSAKTKRIKIHKIRIFWHFQAAPLSCERHGLKAFRSLAPDTAKTSCSEAKNKTAGTIFIVFRCKTIKICPGSVSAHCLELLSIRPSGGRMRVKNSWSWWPWPEDRPDGRKKQFISMAPFSLHCGATGTDS